MPRSPRTAAPGSRSPTRADQRVLRKAPGCGSAPSLCVGCQDVAVSVPLSDERRLRIADRAYRYIAEEVRPYLAAGGRLWTKGSAGHPRRVRQLLHGLDETHPVTYATRDAMELEPRQRIVEHVTPMKRIVIEIVDPAQADPRSNTAFAPIAGGPATSAEQLLSIFDRLLVKCWVTNEEHDRLNRAARSYQWDAPNGDGWARYRKAGVMAYPLTPGGFLATPDEIR